jgi:hypothetical protein
VINFSILEIFTKFILTSIVVLFFIGLIGIILNRKNILIVIMSIELLLLAVNLNFARCWIYLDDIVGQIFIYKNYMGNSKKLQIHFYIFETKRANFR